MATETTKTAEQADIDAFAAFKQAQKETEAARAKWEAAGWRLGRVMTPEQRQAKEAYDRAVDAERSAREAAIKANDAFMGDVYTEVDE